MKKVQASGIHYHNNMEQDIWKETHVHFILSGGFRVRVDVHAGAWWCNSCVGKTEGSQLIQPNCGYCQYS